MNKYADIDFEVLTINREFDSIIDVVRERKKAGYVYNMKKGQLLDFWTFIKNRNKVHTFCGGVVSDILKYRITKYKLEEYILRQSDIKKIKEHAVFTYRDKCYDHLKLGLTFRKNEKYFPISRIRV